jgi:DNA-binding transcriptional regulator YiaG
LAKRILGEYSDRVRAGSEGKAEAMARKRGCVELSAEQRAGIGARLRWLRQKLGLTRREVAARLGVTFNAIGDYECAHHAPSAGVLVRLMEAYGVSADWILTGKDAF